MPPSEWPFWARGCHARSTSSVTGAAAISAHAAAAGVSLPRGNANRSVASRLQLDSVFSRLSSRFATALSAALDALREDADLPRDSAAPLALEAIVAAPPAPIDPSVVASLVTSAESVATRVAAVPAHLPSGIASVDFVVENPLNALWILLLTCCLALDGWDVRTTSYCKKDSWFQALGGLGYRKTTRFMSSLFGTRPFPAPCTPGDPCPHLVRGRHPTALGAAGARGVNGYAIRSRVPPPLTGSFVAEFIACRASSPGARLLVIDLCSGLESLRAGVRLRRRDVSAAGAVIRYFSVDLDPALSPDLVADLSEVSLAEIVTAALSHHGWSTGPAPHVLFWFSPPCETYSRMVLGTLSAARYGGPQRAPAASGYSPVPGPRGDRARAADALVTYVLSQFLPWAAASR